MSHHGGYGGPPPERWDSDRFMRERERIERSRPTAPVVERDRFVERDRYEGRLSPPSGGSRRREISADAMYYRRETNRPPTQFEDRFQFEERYGPPARRPGRRYDDDVESFDDGPAYGVGQLVPFDKRRQSVTVERDYRRSPGPARTIPRPGLLRRQSSLDTFDRKPMVRYGDRIRDSPETIGIPTGRRRRSPPRFVERDFEEIRVADPDYYGDDDYRGFREREINTVRTRRSGGDEIRELEREEIEIVDEPGKPVPKRGKTKMPMRLINKRAIIELGYPFEEEGETLIILKALGKERIDEVIQLSREFNEKGETKTTYVIEPSPVKEDEVVERRTQIVIENPNVPRSIREWDDGHGNGERAVSPSGKSAKSTKTSKSTKSHHTQKSSHTVRSPSPAAKSHKSSSHTVRSPSPAAKSHKSSHTHRSSHSHRSSHRSPSSSSSSSSATIRREIIEEREESGSIHGPLTLIAPDRRKDERSIRAEIRALEAEKKALKLEREIEKEHRHRHHDVEYVVEKERRPTREVEYVVEKERRPSREVEYVLEKERRPVREVEYVVEKERRSSELIIDRDRNVEVVKIEKDRKAPPNPKMVKAMLATLT